MVLAMPLATRLSRRSLGRSVRVVGVEDQRSDRFIGLATAGVAAFGALVPLMALVRMAVYPLDLTPTRYAVAVAATACFLPLHEWLVVSAARNLRPRGRGWAAVAEAAVIIGTFPLVGVDWLGALYPLATLVLITVRVPWSLLLFTVLATVPAPMLVGTGHREWAVYFTVGLLTFGPSVAVLVWLLAKVRELQAARLALAETAVVRERLRIDDDLRETVGAELAAMTAQGDRAAALATRDPAATARELDALVESSRRTLARARRMVRQYQKPSLDAELDSAATLLSTAGVTTRVVLPTGLTIDAVPESLHAALHSGTARLLGDGSVRNCTIEISRKAGEIRLEMRTDGGDAARAPG
jgi:two-component system, NarL family, sensor histidine kinase DesK